MRSRMRYALPAAAVAIVMFASFGGAADQPGDLPSGGDPSGLVMLIVPAGVLVLLLRRTHLVVGLFAGIGKFWSLEKFKAPQHD